MKTSLKTVLARYSIVSIIYKALQKTQKNRDRITTVSAVKKSTKNPHWIDLGLITVIGILVFVILHAYYPQASHYFTHKKNPVITPIAIPLINEADYKNKHTLNGTFISDTTKIAMINNQYHHLGEGVDGMKIVGIDDNLVTLQNDKQIFVLKVMV
jgi:hypothetical protein